MNLLLRHLALFALLFIGNSAVHAVELPGTWSNGESEFKTISLMLRADGQAVFATAVLPNYAHWEKSDTGLNLTLAGEGKSLTLPLTYDPATETLNGELHDTRLILRKISEQEPPDMLARAKAKQAEDTARWKKQFRMEERKLADKTAVRALLQDWLNTQSASARAESLFLSAKGSYEQLTLRWLGGPNCFISIVLENRRTTKPSGYPLESKLLKSDATSDLPLAYELPAPMRTSLETLGKRPGLKMEINAFSQVSAFETESFYRSMQFIVPLETDTLVLSDEIMAILWPSKQSAYTVKLHFRTPRE